MAGQQDKDSSSEMLYVMVFFAIIFFLVMAFFGENIAAVLLKVRHGWAYLASLLPFTSKFDHILLALNSYSPREWLNKTGAITQLSGDLRFVMGVPMGLILFWMAYKVNKKAPANALRKVFNRESLLDSQANIWPFIIPVQRLNIIDEPIDSGPWAMAKRPVNFCKDYHLLKGKDLDKIRAEKFFSTQLGNLWEGPKRLSKSEKALFACFAAHLCHDKDGCMQGLEDLSRKTLPSGMRRGDKLDKKGKPIYQMVKEFVKPSEYAITDALLKKYKDDPRVLEVVAKYAYNTTVLMGLLEAARKNGVIPSSFFIWLRPYNRSLWYALNTVGRATSVCESAGVFAHFLAEKIAQHKLERPYVKEATNALEISLREYIYD